MTNIQSTVDRFTPPVHGCSFCDRPPGLAVLPVRYAVVGPEDKEGAPPLAGNFHIEHAPTQLGGGAQYTLRTMRPGFLYVFHEATLHWDCYLVVNGGHLWKIIPERPTPPRVSTEFSCSVGIGHGYMSMYFTIPDPKRATRVWYAYSHVAWTPAQLDENKFKPEVRSQHMQMLNVQAWLASANQPHAARSTELGKHVASFAMPPKDQDEAFRHLSAPPRIKAGDRLDLIGEAAGAILSLAMERASPGHALMLACNDPLAMTEDLALLSNDVLHPKAHDGVVWDKKTDLLLNALEANIRENAVRNMTKEAEDAAVENERNGVTLEGYPTYEFLSAVFSPEKTAARWKREDAEREADRQTKQEDVAEAAWKPYAKVLDKSMRHRDHGPRLKALNETILAPIARSHAQWLMSGQLEQYMSYRHDSRDIAHGCVYNEAMARCLEHGVGNAECLGVVKRWCDEANPLNPSNLLARGLHLNHDELIKTAAGYTDQGLAAMLETFKAILDKFDQTSKAMALPDQLSKIGLMPRLTWVLGNQIIPALAHSLHTKTAKMFLNGLSLAGGVRLVGVSRDIMSVRHTVLHDLNTTNPALYKHLGRSRRREEAVVVSRRAKRMAANSNLVWYDKRDLAAAKDLASLQLRDQHEVPGLKQVRAVLGSRHVNIGAVSVILQGLALFHATQSFRAAGEFDEEETGMKLMGGLVAMTGTLMEQAGILVEKAPTHPFVARVMRAMPDADWAERGQRWARKGRLVGFLGALVGIGWDAVHSREEFAKGNQTLGYLYGGSTVSGAMAAAIAVGWISLPSWPFLVVLFGANVGISIVDDPATLKWAQRCRFSAPSGKPKFSSMEDESFAFSQLGIRVEEEQPK